MQIHTQTLTHMSMQVHTYKHTQKYTETHRCTDTHRDTHTQTLTDTNTHRHVHVHTHAHSAKHTEVKTTTHVFPGSDHLQEARQLVITGSCRTPTCLPGLPPLAPDKVCFPPQAGGDGGHGTDRQRFCSNRKQVRRSRSGQGGARPLPPGQVPSSLPGRLPGQGPPRSCVAWGRAGREAGR